MKIKKIKVCFFFVVSILALNFFSCKKEDPAENNPAPGSVIPASGSPCNLTAPVISVSDTVNYGDTLFLNAQLVSNATYLWTGPANFNSNLQNPIITNFSPQHTGEYSCKIRIGNCTSSSSSKTVSIYYLVPCQVMENKIYYNGNFANQIDLYGKCGTNIYHDTYHNIYFRYFHSQSVLGDGIFITCKDSSRPQPGAYSIPGDLTVSLHPNWDFCGPVLGCSFYDLTPGTIYVNKDSLGKLSFSFCNLPNYNLSGNLSE